MKKILFLMGLLLAVLLFLPAEEIDMDSSVQAEREAVMKEKNTADDMKHRIEVISKDLKSSNGLTSRRHVQSTHYSPQCRILKLSERILQELRLKGTDQLQKVSEYISIRQTLHYSALLTCKGYHIFALRKIIRWNKYVQ